MLRPPPLSAGARVALVSPSGPLRGDHEVQRAEENVRSFGWTPLVSPHARGTHGYFAGEDRDRISDLNAAISDASVDAIWCLRGGYGAMRIIPEIDFAPLCERPKALIGFSDITALHLAIQAQCGHASYHGPTARATLDEFTRRSLLAAVTHDESCGEAPEARVIRPGRATGRIIGGNLALLSSLVGTPWAPDLNGALLLLEDVNEPVYRMDRMLQQLLLSNTLDGCKGILFGHCTSCVEEADGGGSRKLDDVLTEIAEQLDVPCLAGIPVGHIDRQWTVPLGIIAEMDTGSKTVRTVNSFLTSAK